LHGPTAMVDHISSAFKQNSSDFFLRMEGDIQRRLKQEQHVQSVVQRQTAKELAKTTLTGIENNGDHRDAICPLTRRFNLLSSLFAKTLDKDKLTKSSTLSQERLRSAMIEVNARIPNENLRLTREDVEGVLWDADKSGDGEITKAAFNAKILLKFGEHTTSGAQVATGSRYQRARDKAEAQAELSYTLKVVRLSLGAPENATPGLPLSFPANTNIGEVRAVLRKGMGGLLHETDAELNLHSDTHVSSLLSDSVLLSDTSIRKPHNVITLYIR